jgi:phytoene dehydrogenase-like protein
VLKRLTRNRQSIGVLTGQWGDYGLPPAQSSFAMLALIVNHYLEGASYPVGGASRLDAALVPAIQRAGGRVLLDAEVKQIVVEGRRAVGVELADGRILRAAAVVSGVGESYESLKQTFVDRLLQVLYQHVPSVRGRVDHAELSTPLSTRHFAGYSQGEPYGLAHTPARFKQRFLQPRTPIRNLYLTGQDIAVCGIAGALVSGVLTASSLLGRNLFR